jgi:hypothetical protein
MSELAAVASMDALIDTLLEARSDASFAAAVSANGARQRT